MTILNRESCNAEGDEADILGEPKAASIKQYSFRAGKELTDQVLAVNGTKGKKRSYTAGNVTSEHYEADKYVAS